MVTLIRENLHTFLVSGKDEWQKVAKVLARFANMPEPEYREDLEYIKAARSAAVFDASRYEVKPLNPNRIHGLFAQRGISEETVRELTPFIVLIRDRHNGNFEGFNIGFPTPTVCPKKRRVMRYVAMAATSPRLRAATLLLRHGWQISHEETGGRETGVFL